MMVGVIIVNLRIRDLREDSNLSQQEIADMLGINQSYYSKCERDVRTLHLADAVKLAEFYKTSVDYLVGLTDVREPYPKSRRK